MEFERMTVSQIKESILNKLHTQFACDVADATPEQLFGSGFMEEAYRESPDTSRERIRDHLRSFLPSADEKALRKLIG